MLITLKGHLCMKCIQGSLVSRASPPPDFAERNKFRGRGGLETSLVSRYIAVGSNLREGNNRLSHSIVHTV